MKSDRLHIDIETFSEANLKKVGVYRYAEDPSTEILMVCYALNDGPVRAWLPLESVPNEVLAGLNLDEGAEIHVQLDCPEQLARWLSDPAIEVAAHNANFERTLFDRCAFARARGIPTVPIKRWVCTAVKAAVYGLPRALEHAANALGTYPKDDTGHNVMLSLAKPRTGAERRYTPENAPDRYFDVLNYCMDDVRAERGLDDRIPDITKYERTRWRLDQKINDRGVKVDLKAIDDLQYLIDEYKARLEDFCERHTEHEVHEYDEEGEIRHTRIVRLRPSQTGKLADWIRDNGYPQLENLQAPTVKEAVKDPECPPEIKRVLKCYSLHTMKAVAKYAAMKNAVCADGRIRGMFMFYGAGPGRWSSRIVQLQNMLRPLIKDVDLAIEMMGYRDLELIEWMWDLNPMKIFASCTRGVLVADEGKILTAFDFAQIESRIQAWVSDAQWKLDFFESDSDFKIYHKTGSMMFGLPMEQIVDKGEDQKYTGAKIGELACIAENELVLTDKGLVPIQNVTLNMRVWDGEQFEFHGGVVCRGTKNVITYDGLTATPDHVVWTEESGEIQFEKAAARRECLTKRGAGGLPIRSNKDHNSGEALQQEMGLLLRSSAVRRVWARGMVLAGQLNSAKNEWLRSVCAKGPKNRCADVAYEKISRSKTTLHESARQQLEELRSARNSLSFRVCLRGRVIREAKTWFASAQRIGSNTLQRTLRAGELAILNTGRTAAQSTGLGIIYERYGVGEAQKSLRFPHVDSSIENTESQTNSFSSKSVGEAESKKLARNSTTTKTARVYDIVNAGPRNRFTVSDCLVHNCGYGGGEAAIEKFARQMSIKLTIPAIEIRDRWREANKEQVKCWYALEEAMRSAIANPGQAFALKNKKIMFRVVDRWLHLRLPSGRTIKYLDPMLLPDGSITYMGTNTHTRKRERVDTYGGKILQNCLAADTLVLADSGWKPIQDYVPADKLWDGVEWVRAGRLLEQGEAFTIEYEGVTLTPDHEVLTDEGWKAAALAQSERLNRAQVRLPDNSPLYGQSKWQNVLGSSMCLRKQNQGRGSWLDALTRPLSQVLRLQNKCPDRTRQHDTRVIRPSDSCGVGFDDSAVQQSETCSLSQLRRTRNSCLQALVALREFCRRYAACLAQRFNLGPGQEQPWLLVEQLSMAFAHSASAQHSLEPLHRNPRGQNDDCGSERSIRHPSMHLGVASEAGMAGGAAIPETRSRKQVFDIANAGPRRRFVVWANGAPLLVHNCSEGIGWDLLTAGMLNMERAGYPAIMSVHDEGVFEIPIDFGSEEESMELMTAPEEWAKGLPVKCNGWRKPRYRK